MSHHNYPGNPEITIQDCNTPRTPGSIQQYFPPNQGVCIQPNRGAIEKNQLWNNRQLYFSDKCNQPYNKTSPYSERAPKVMIGNQKIYNSYPTYNANNSIVQNLFSIIEIPDEKFFACSAYDKLSIINGNNIEVSKTGAKNTFSISTTDNINIPGNLTVSGDTKLTDLTVTGDLKLTGIKSGSQNYVLYYNVDNNCVTYSTAPTGNGGVGDHDHQGDDSLGDYIHDNNFTIEGNLTVEQNFVVHGDASFCDVSACNIDISENLAVFGDASFCDVSACNLTVNGAVCFPGLDEITTNYTLYYNDVKKCITYGLKCCGDGDDLAVVGNLTVGGNLRVRGDTTLEKKLMVLGDASLCDVSACNLQVDGDASLCDVFACNLQVDGDVSAYNIDVGRDLVVVRDTQLQGKLTVGGETLLNAKLVVDADASFCDVSACNLQVDGSACFTNLVKTTANHILYYNSTSGCITYDVSENGVINSDLDIHGDVTVDGGMEIILGLEVGHDLTVDGDFVLKGDASLCDVSACNIDISEKLVVFGDASFCDVSACNLQVDGSACFTGLEQASSNYTLYYDAENGCITYDTSGANVADDFLVQGNLRVLGDTELVGDLRVEGDASLCDVSACNIDISYNLNVGRNAAIGQNATIGQKLIIGNLVSGAHEESLTVADNVRIYGHTEMIDLSACQITLGDGPNCYFVSQADASFCDISACNIDITDDLKVGNNVRVGNNVTVGNDLEVSGITSVKVIFVEGHSQLNDVSMNDLVARDASFVDVSACNIDISKNLYVGGHTLLSDVSASRLELLEGNIMYTLDLDWDKDGNKLRNHTSTNTPTNFTTLEIDPGDVLHIYCRYVTNIVPAPGVHNSVVVTVREVRANEIIIADRFTDSPPLCSPSNEFKVIVNKQKMRMIAGDLGIFGYEEDAFSTWRVDNLGDLHIIPSGTDGSGGAPCQDGGVSIWGQTEILRGADPTGGQARGHAKLKITCYNSEAVAANQLSGNPRSPRPGEAILDMKASDDTMPCRIYFGNVGNHDISGSNVDSSNNTGIGRIEYFNCTTNNGAHTGDRMRFCVSNGLPGSIDGENYFEALSINTRHNPTASTTYRPYIGISEPDPQVKLDISSNETGVIVAARGAQGRTVTIGGQGTGAYIDAPSTTLMPFGTDLQLQSGSQTVVTCNHLSGSYPSSFDLTSRRLTIDSVAGTANQVLTATGNGAEVAWRTSTGGGTSAVREIIPYEPWNPTIGHVTFDMGANIVYMHQFHAPSTGSYDKMTLSIQEVVSQGTGFRGYIGVALYNNIEANGKPGEPTSTPVAKGANNYDTLANGGLGPHQLSKEYVTVEFDNSVELTANTLYWAAISREGTQTLRIMQHQDYNPAQNKVIRLSGSASGTTLSTGTWPQIGATNVTINDSERKAFWFRISGPATAAGAINDLTVYRNLDVLGDLVARDASFVDISSCNIDISKNLYVGGDTTLQDISASNIGITGDASFCDIYTCNIDAAGTVNISDAAALPNKLVINNVGSTNPSTHAPHNYDSDFTSVSAAGYSYIKCKMTGTNNAVYSNFQVDGDGSIKNQGSITTYYGVWGNASSKRLSFVAKDTSSNSLITNTYSHGSQDLALQCANPSTAMATVKIVPPQGKIGTDFQFENVNTATNWRNTLYWSHEKLINQPQLLFMSAHRVPNASVHHSLMNFDFCYGTGSSTNNILSLEQPTNLNSLQQPQITIGDASAAVILGSGVQNPFTYSLTGTKVSCSYIDSNDISCNNFRADYIDSLRYNDLVIGQKSKYVQIACSGSAPTWLSTGGIHLGISSDITCGDNTINCTSNSGICETRHKGTIGTFSASSSCGTRLRGYSSVTMTSIVGGIAAKLCVLKNKVEQSQDLDPGFITCSSIEGPQATIIMRGKALLKLPNNAVNVNNWYNTKMEINIDAATSADDARGALLAPHSVKWVPQTTTTPGQGMPPGTFNKMFDVANATFMVTSGTLKTVRGEEPVASVNIQDPTIPVFDYKWLYAKLSSNLPTVGGGDYEAKFEIGAMMMGMPMVGGVSAEGLVVNYMITVPRRFWSDGAGNPETFFANVPVNPSDLNGEYYWNSYKNAQELDDNVGPWNNNGPYAGPSDSFQPQTTNELQAAVDMWVANNPSALTAYGDINRWDVSLITDMQDLFKEKNTFNDNISNWDVSNVTNMHGMFEDAEAFNQNLSSWNVSSVTNMSNMFSDAHAFNGDISSWNVSSVTNMSVMFSDARAFNANISSWNVSNVTNMDEMFQSALVFNQDISSWNVSNVTTMYKTFEYARAFNANISSWNVSNVGNMYKLFHNANSFNADVSSWNVSKVGNMGCMFCYATNFNANISSWNVSKVSNMAGMFWNATSFNQDISGWNVSSVTKMNIMFEGAIAFNQNLSSWDVSNVTDMTNMFNGATALSDNNKCAIQQSFETQKPSVWPYDWGFSPTTLAELQTAVNAWIDDKNAWMAATGWGDINTWCTTSITDMQDLFKDKNTFNDNISNWDVSNVTNMHGMFEGAEAFNQNLSSWNVSNVTDMREMFRGAEQFDGSIGNWTVSNVTNMRKMFRTAENFNQDISGWDVSSVVDMEAMFQEARKFNQNISTWKAAPTSMSYMFAEATSFNQDISSWDVSKVSNMNRLFDLAAQFNQDISSWNVSNVTDMTNMFNGATALSDNNKCAIQQSFKSQRPSVWPYEWCAFTQIILGDKGTGKYAAATGDHPPAAAWTPWGAGPTVASGHNQFYAHPWQNAPVPDTAANGVDLVKAANDNMWLQYELSAPEKVIRYSFTIYHNTTKTGEELKTYIRDYRGRMPRSFTLWGSNNGTTFVKLDTRNADWGSSPWATAGITSTEDRHFDITNSVAYGWYRVTLDRVGSSGENLLRIVQIKLWKKTNDNNVQVQPVQNL